MRLAAAALVAALAVAPAADAAKRPRAKVVLKKAAKGRAHVPKWLLRPIAPAAIPVSEPAPAPPAEGPAPAPQPGAPEPGAPPAPKFHRSGVDLDEYSVVIARNPLDAGTIELVARNFGEDDHDMALSRDGTLIAKTDVIVPGAEATLTATVSAGSYKVFCSLLDHDAQGMNRGLLVR